MYWTLLNSKNLIFLHLYLQVGEDARSYYKWLCYKCCFGVGNVCDMYLFSPRLPVCDRGIFNCFMLYANMYACHTVPKTNRNLRIKQSHTRLELTVYNGTCSTFGHIVIQYQYIWPRNMTLTITTVPTVFTWRFRLFWDSVERWCCSFEEIHGGMEAAQFIIL